MHPLTLVGIKKDPMAFLRLMQPLCAFNVERVLPNPERYYAFEVMTNRKMFARRAKIPSEGEDYIIRELEKRGYVQRPVESAVRILFLRTKEYLPELLRGGFRRFTEYEILSALKDATNTRKDEENRFGLIRPMIALMEEAYRPQGAQRPTVGGDIIQQRQTPAPP